VSRNVHPFYQPTFDFAPQSYPPRKVVCFHFVPRSGSNLLADLIWQTGALGHPLEYFSSENLAEMMARFGSTGEMISARTTQNGVFSFKWNSDFEKIPFAREIYAGLQPQHHILVDRRDVRAQSKSFARSRKTGQWVTTASSKTAGRRAFSWTDMLRARYRLWRTRMATKSYLNSQNADVLTIYYEDLLAAPRKTLVRIFDHCGETPPADLPETAISMVQSGP